MLDADYTPTSSTLDILLKDFGLIMEEAKALRFPLPLGSMAHQQFLLASACGFGHEDDAAIVKIWEKTMSISVAAPKVKNNNTTLEELHTPQQRIVQAAEKPKKVAFIGLGAMGFGMASWLLKEKFTVRGFDVYPPSMERFVKAGGESSSSPHEAVQGAQVVVLMVTNQDQAQSVLYGPDGAVPALSKGAVVVLCSTVSPDYVRHLETQLAGEGQDFVLVDAPVSGGVVKAANGSLTIMAAGSDEAFHRAGAVLSGTHSEVIFRLNLIIIIIYVFTAHTMHFFSQIVLELGMLLVWDVLFGDRQQQVRIQVLGF
jgi:3-hydroxyisobutyrate dehydrogenase-like beta-hydroxyacid dehydrogenase